MLALADASPSSSSSSGSRCSIRTLNCVEWKETFHKLLKVKFKQLKLVRYDRNTFCSAHCSVSPCLKRHYFQCQWQYFLHMTDCNRDALNYCWWPCIAALLTSRYCRTMFFLTSSVSEAWAKFLEMKSIVCRGLKWILLFLFTALSYTLADSVGEYFWILLLEERVNIVRNKD